MAACKNLGHEKQEEGTCSIELPETDVGCLHHQESNNVSLEHNETHSINPIRNHKTVIEKTDYLRKNIDFNLHKSQSEFCSESQRIQTLIVPTQSIQLL